MQIHLKEASPIEIESVVRVVPQQREVVRGVWRDSNGETQSVYAKKFLGPRAYKHFQRDLAGVKSFLRANIATPPILFEGKAETQDAVYVSVFLAIQNARNTEEVWKELGGQSRFELALKLVQVIAQHHRVGLIQTDLYLKNFLLADDVIYSLDGDGVRSLCKVFSGHQRLNNIAKLFSKMDALDGVWIEQLYQQYCFSAGVVFSASDLSRVQYLTQKIRHQIASSYADKKVFRQCTDVNVTQDYLHFLAVAVDFKVESNPLLSLDQLLFKTQLNIKNGKTSTVAKATLANRQVIIKRYNIKSFWHGLKRAFRITRAAKSWANAHRLIISNIATAKPLALVEQRIGCLRRRAYYLSEYVDAPDAQQFFAQSTSEEEKNLAARNLAKLFYKLYLLKFSHGDFKATNLKMVNLEPVLIDLDSMQAHFGCWFSEWRFERAHIKDLKRFMKNWQDNSELSGLLKEAIINEYATDSSLSGILIRAGIA